MTWGDPKPPYIWGGACLSSPVPIGKCVSGMGGSRPESGLGLPCPRGEQGLLVLGSLALLAACSSTPTAGRWAHTQRHLFTQRQCASPRPSWRPVCWVQMGRGASPSWSSCQVGSGKKEA